MISLSSSFFLNVGGELERFPSLTTLHVISNLVSYYHGGFSPTHPPFLTAVGLSQSISHCRHPTLWIKNKASSRLLFHFSSLNFTCFHSEEAVYCTKWVSSSGWAHLKFENLPFCRLRHLCGYHSKFIIVASMTISKCEKHHIFA